MRIRALKPFTYRDADTGALISYACGAIATVDDTLAGQFITDGLAEEYTLISPTGSVTLTANGDTNDVTEYANAIVNVPGPAGKITISENGTDIDVAEYATADVAVPAPTTYGVAYDSNGGTGSYPPSSVVSGTEIELIANPFTAQAGQHFVNWHCSVDAQTYEAGASYTVSANVVFKAQWAND